MANQKEFIINRVFNAPKEKVWEAWTNPDKIKKWWGPKDFTAPVVKSDLRPGGKYLYCMRGKVAPDAPKQDFWSSGIFQEIVPMEKTVISDGFSDEKGNRVPASYYGMDPNWPLEMRVEATFKDAGPNKTEFTLRYPDISRINEKDLNDMNEGWNQSLDKLEEIFKQN